jgi:hypothetical protein
MGILWVGWFVWAVLLFALGTRHQRTVFDEVPLTRRRKYAGVAAALLFLLSFSPNPFPV